MIYIYNKRQTLDTVLYRGLTSTVKNQKSDLQVPLKTKNQSRTGTELHSSFNKQNNMNSN
jgi:hypothetical protein